MTKFKVGDKVVIKDNFHGHGFQMEDVVVISKLEFGGYEGHKVGDDPEECWVFDDSEIEEYKERTKVQKFKVGDKVRMVKLRSDGLSYSFDKIGNEGVVKDVGLRFIRVDVHCKANTWEGNGWTYPLDNKCWELVEEEKEMPKCKFKVGDLVKGNDPRRYAYTNDKMTKGVVLGVYNHGDIKVKILEHSMKEVVGDAYNVDPQYFDFYEEPKLVQKEKPKATVLKLGEYKIVFNGDTTVVTDGTRKGVAKRHPDDEYDAVVGLQVALERFTCGRKPKIGDKVRVLKVDGDSPYSDHHWKVGDIAEVVSFASSDGTSIMCRIEGKSYGFSYQTLIAGEYEVLG